MRNNKKGFSYIEIIIVMAMLCALLATSTGSFVTLWNARASKGANTIDALLSQSKVNSLSGDDNYVKVYFDGSDYIAELWHEGGTQSYKQETIGNSRLSVRIGDADLTEGKYFFVKFDSKTGEVIYAGITDGTSRPKKEDTPDSIKIYVSSGNSYCITLWRRTGEHRIG